MTLVFISIIGCVSSYIASFVPWVWSSLSISSMMLLGISPQIAKSTFQLWLFWFCIGWLRDLLHTQKIHREYFIIFSIIALIWGYIGGNILVTIPTDMLIKLTGFFMFVLLAFNLTQKDLWILSKHISRKRKFIGYIISLILCVATSVFPMWSWVVYQFFYTYVFRLTILEYKVLSKVTYFPFIVWLIVPLYLSGLLNISYVIAYFLWSFIGAHFGTRHGILVGNKWLKNILILWLMLLGVYFMIFA